MLSREPDPFAALDEAERNRLEKLYEGLREKLLDLTKKNRMLNYSLGARSKRHLQIVDEAPEEVYRLLNTDNSTLEVVPLPEPDDTPHDEKTEEFISALEHAKVSDIDYLTRLKVLESIGRDDDNEIMAAERELRRRLRAQLGMLPRPERIEINRNEHAQRLGIDANPELPKLAAKKSHRDKKLQTLKFPDELEAAMDKIAADARLAEQEMGLSTLFLSFGFLEWYESDSSDRKHFAPLLLLPVRLETRKLQGKKVFSIATAESAESNLSLQKYLEREFGRSLPDFEAEDEESAGSIEMYLGQVQNTIEGLNRWRVRRWLILGHFAFGRLAMYADLAADKWKHHPAGHKLVRSVLAGTEDSDGAALSSLPDDYPIDDPNFEKIAPFLIYDADASQHSALIDVVRESNLAIQGPPGTGKSQTITNVIANYLAVGKTVLFISEKQAALDVVKRRLDRAGLGEFCLEIHSDKSSSKQIITNVRRRIELGFAKGKLSPAQPHDLTWLESRRTISEYLTVLHATADDGQTPFHLMWRSIRGRSVYADLIGSFKKVELPSVLLDKPTEIATVSGQVEIYANAAQSFSNLYGHPAQSPWAQVNIDSLQNYEISNLMETLGEVMASADAILTLVRQNADLLTANIDELRRVVSAAPVLSHPPSDRLLAHIVPLDLCELELALQLCRELKSATDDLKSRLDLSAVPSETMSRAIAIAEVANRHDLLALTPAQLFDEIARRTDDLQILIAAIEGLLPTLEATGFDESFETDRLEAVATVTVVVSKLSPAHRPWLGRFRDIDLEFFESSRQRWANLVAAEGKWRRRIGDRRAPWPPAVEIAAAAKTIGKGRIGTLFAKIGGSEKVARELITRLGLDHGSPPTSDDLTRLAAHVHGIENFLSDQSMRNILGDVWSGLETPFNDIAIGLKVRTFLTQKLSDLPGSEIVIERVLELGPERLSALALHEEAASAFRALPERLRCRLGRAPLKNLLSVLEGELAQGRQILAIDPDRNLIAIDLPVSEISSIANIKTHQGKLEQALSRMPLAVVARSLGANDAQLRSTREAIEWIRSVHSFGLSPSLREGLFGPSATAVSQRMCRLGSELEKAISDYDQTIEGFRTRFGLDALISADLEKLVHRINALMANRSQLSDFLALRKTRKGIEGLGLGAFLNRADTINLAPDKVPSALSVLLAHGRADQARRKHPALGQAAGSLLEARRHAFADRDKKKIDADRAMVRACLLPAKQYAGNSAGPKKTWTEMALIKNELEKQQRFIPIRRLIERAHHSLQALMPCFMMSPLSLAKFLPAESIEFDIAIIDEASQVRPEDALGGLLRAKQVVVVGDAKQLPPTNFFNRTDGADGSTDDDEEYEDVDDESILEACQKAFRRTRRLKWHYRSRCESLIAFSNREFYDNSLITFPTARPGSFSIDLVRVNGTYQGRQNVAEALRVAEEAIAFMRHHASCDKEALATLGIAAVNIEQRDLIREELRRLSAGDEKVDEFVTKAEEKGEPLFVKNLENVQGDERDFILISMTYGREPGANVLKQRFGPINSKQGHRRLNVLFTRARQRIGFFTSFGSTDVKPSEKSHEGVRVLQRYLEYAEGHGRLAVEKVGHGVDSDFEMEVADRLRAKGYEVNYQVGVSGFRIDLGVRDPDRPETFLAGIECDGAQYHSSKSARDRDRLREEVLRGLGWKILRVWSTDWFENPDEETGKLVLKLKKLQTESRADVAADDYRFTTASRDDGAAAGLASDDVTTLAADPGAIDVAAEPTSAKPQVVQASATDGVDMAATMAPILGRGGRITSKEGARALREFRETVIAKEMADWEPERSILRDGMIETFVTIRLKDPDDWFRRVPQYQRQNTNPVEKKKYLERICEIIERIEEVPSHTHCATSDEISIQSRDYWFKMVDMLQQNWALIEPKGAAGVVIHFVDDTSGVFDEMASASAEAAAKALRQNGFRRYVEDTQAQAFLRPPPPPFHRSTHPNGPIYSSGRYWK